MDRQDILVIGIAGGTGSGKTTVTRKLREAFGDEVCVLNHDSYYKRYDNLTYEQRTQLNYDHPDTFDTAMMVEHLRLLKSGQPILCPVYDYTIYNRTDDTLEITPRPVIIVEGILIFADKPLRELMDIKIFVDTDADTRILRRLVRDVKKRGRTMDSVISQYLTTVKPMHEQFVQPSRQYADLVMLEGGQNSVALEMLMHRISQHLVRPE